MPSDRSPSPSRSLLPYSSRASWSPSSSFRPYLSHPSSNALSPSDIRATQYGPYQPSSHNATGKIRVLPRFPIHGLPQAHTAPQQPSAIPNVFTSVDNERLAQLPPYHACSTSPSPSPSAPCQVATSFINDAPHIPPRADISQGMFYQARDFVIKDSVLIDHGSDKFMVSFLRETIPRAEFDSSDPNMPLRCHPGTRLEVIKRCQDFILTCHGPQKLRWVVGAAGVGKSAIMQSVAQDESNILSDIIVGATIFFSINGRQDGTKTITTIAYQLAVKLDSYRLFIQREVTRNPSLLRKSLSTQFKKFIVEPFVHHHLLDPSSRLLIMIDDLDECANPSTQQELLGLISFFCITYPSSPLIWMVASRPELHITSFFSQPNVVLSYEKEEIVADSDDAHEDVIRYLHDKLREVQMSSITLRHLSQWPSDGDFRKVAEASGGLFAYASTVVRYISDLTYGDPVSQLDDVLNIIEAGEKSTVPGQGHPMAQLDALYAHIMSTIPAKVMANTRKLLLLYVGETGWTDDSLRFGCNMLGMRSNTAYGATHHIQSIASIPGPNDAEKDGIEFFHKSFPDYLRDAKRSGFSFDIDSEAEELAGQCGLRIIEEAPDGVYMDDISDDGLNFGIRGVFRNGPGTGESISVAWPSDGDRENREIRFKIFRRAVWDVIAGLKRRERAFQSLLCIRVLTTCFTRLPLHFPIDALRDLVFDGSRRRELVEQNILRQVTLETLDYDEIPKSAWVRLRYKSLKVADPYEATCKHEREGRWGGPNQDWSTNFVRPGGRNSLACNSCFQRFTCHFNARLPGHLVTVLDLTPTYRVVELQFVDLEDGGSEWIYVFDHGDWWECRR